MNFKWKQHVDNVFTTFYPETKFGPDALFIIIIKLFRHIFILISVFYINSSIRYKSYLNGILTYFFYIFLKKIQNIVNIITNIYFFFINNIRKSSDTHSKPHIVNIIIYVPN